MLFRSLGIDDSLEALAIPDYVARWGALTLVGLLRAREDTARAVSLFDRLWNRTRSAIDRTFDGALALEGMGLAQHLGHTADVARWLERADSSGCTRQIELQAKFYQLAGACLQPGPAAQALATRGISLQAAKGLPRLRAHRVQNSPQSGRHLPDKEIQLELADRLSSLFDLAHTSGVFASELKELWSRLQIPTALRISQGRSSTGEPAEIGRAHV